VIKNDELEGVEETAAEIEVVAEAPEPMIGDIGLGAIAATEAYGIPSVDVDDEGAEDIVVGKVDSVVVTVARGAQSNGQSHRC
jgi:hypothetical protein